MTAVTDATFRSSMVKEYHGALTPKHAADREPGDIEARFGDRLVTIPIVGRVQLSGHGASIIGFLEQRDGKVVVIDALFMEAGAYENPDEALASLVRNIHDWSADWFMPGK